MAAILRLDTSQFPKLATPGKLNSPRRAKADSVRYVAAAKRATIKASGAGGGPRNPYILHLGKRHKFLQVEFPQRQIIDGRYVDLPAADRGKLCCPTCGYAFTDMLTRVRCCPECTVERAAAAAQELQDAGIELGWGSVRLDDAMDSEPPAAKRRAWQYSVVVSSDEREINRKYLGAPPKGVAPRPSL